LIVDVMVIVATAVLFFLRFIDLSVFNDGLDAALFWRKGVGSRWVAYPSHSDCREQHHDRVVFCGIPQAGTTLTY